MAFSSRRIVWNVEYGCPYRICYHLRFLEMYRLFMTEVVLKLSVCSRRDTGFLFLREANARCRRRRRRRDPAGGRTPQRVDGDDRSIGRSRRAPERPQEQPLRRRRRRLRRRERKGGPPKPAGGCFELRDPVDDRRRPASPRPLYSV